jgi:hypothetical protein
MAELRRRRHCEETQTVKITKDLCVDDKLTETITERSPTESSRSKAEGVSPRSEKENEELQPTDDEISSTSTSTSTSTWIVTKWVILRLTGLVYLIAFLGAYYQNRGLMGSNGLQPASDFMDSIQNKFASPWEGFQNHPTIFWWMDLQDDRMEAVALAGMTLSALVVLGEDSVILMGLLWLLDFSIVTIASGTSFYNYGWESQLLETGFLALFLCDVLPQFRDRARNRKSPPSPIVLWLFRWLCFRISMGAGLIKIRGDSCWTQKTCLHYHFETQPIPSPMSFFFHFLPKWALEHAVDMDLFVQVYTSWIVLVPTSLPGAPRLLNKLLLTLVRIGGVIQAGFMINIIMSGNFAFLNHLTIIPALACLDDGCWPQFVHTLATGERKRREGKPYTHKTFTWWRPRLLMDLLLLAMIGNLSWPVVDNLFQWSGQRQQMNASFGRFRLVNTYGAFGSVGKGRYEPIVSITYNGHDWHELEFPCKPGTVTRRPCFCAPYHYRVDWNIWFLGFKPHMNMLQGREAWLLSLVSKLLDANAKERPWLDLLDRTSASMLRKNYEKKFQTPLYAKVDMYHYTMAAPLWQILPEYLEGKQNIVWWEREFEEVLIPPVRIDQEGQRLLAVDLNQDT